MLNTYETPCAIISAIFIILYTLRYILHDLYLLTKSKKTRAKINKTLPILTKHNTLFIWASLIFSSIHIYTQYSSNTIFNPGYLTLLLTILIIIIKIFNKKFIDLKQYLTTVPYLLILSLIVHICFI